MPRCHGPTVPRLELCKVEAGIPRAKNRTLCKHFLPPIGLNNSIFQTRWDSEHLDRPILHLDHESIACSKEDIFDGSLLRIHTSSCFQEPLEAVVKRVWESSSR